MSRTVKLTQQFAIFETTTHVCQLPDHLANADDVEIDEYVREHGTLISEETSEDGGMFESTTTDATPQDVAAAQTAARAPRAAVDEHLDRIRDAVLAVLAVKDTPVHDDPTAVAHLITSAAADNWCAVARDHGPEHVSHEPTYAVLAQRVTQARKLIDDYCNQGGRQGELDRMETIDSALTGK